MLPRTLLTPARAATRLTVCLVPHIAKCRYNSTEVTATVIKYSQHGRPQDVLKVEKVKIPTTLKENEVFIKMEAAPINPADLNIIEGAYGAPPPTLPAVAGIEGVGSVAAVGSGVKNLKPNDRVIPAGSSFGTWRSHAVTTEDQLVKVPSDIPIHYAASLSVNLSTAHRLLNDFGDLKAGDVIIQNGANSVVGTAIIQLAKLKGIHTINIVRQGPHTEATITNLKNLGADLVCTHDYMRTPHFRDTIKELKKPKVAFNCVGGDSATELARHLGDGGILVTYGGMSRRPITIPTSLLIFNNIQLRGFWLTKWIQEHTPQERAKVIEELSELVRSGKLKVLLEGHKLSDFEFALKRNSEAHRHRKVILELMH